jgi:hypothetical protein
MRYIVLGFIVALIVAISGIGVLATATQGRVTVQDAKSNSKANNKATLGDSFKKARDSFVKKNTKATTVEIRKEAEFIKSISERTIDASREPLMVSAKDLETLADGVEKGTVTSVKELENVFSNASKALARYYSLKADEALTNKDGKKVGKDLKAAADYLEASFTWVGAKPNESMSVIIKKVREFAKEMTKGKQLEADEASRNVKEISIEIDKIIAKSNKETVKPDKTEK